MEPQAEQTQADAQEPQTLPEEAAMDESVEPEPDNEPAPALPPITWQASEYMHHAKGPLWYGSLLVILAILVLAAVWTKEWLAIAVFACMFAAIVFYGSRQPRTLTYALDQEGLHIESKHYPFSSFRSFSVAQDVAWHAIDLEPTQRFMPRLTILLDNEHVDQIVEHLAAELPRDDRKPDAIERAARFLRF